MEEVEGKFLEINIADLRKRLKANKAKKSIEWFYTNGMFLIY